ncbi:MAG TPA: hypothetical protein VHD87_12645 [Acidimicrobiales bacterium]|nr:hypothetical protein [Acidimicrobiales bacterium]
MPAKPPPHPPAGADRLNRVGVQRRQARAAFLRQVRAGTYSPAALFADEPADDVIGRTKVFDVLVAAGWDRHLVEHTLTKFDIALDARLEAINRARPRLLRAVEHLEAGRRPRNVQWPLGQPRA